MNAVDGSDHYNKANDEPIASLLTIILDTNPHAWALLHPALPLSTAIANLLVFVNSHLAFNHANKVAIIASHTQKAAYLYPVPPSAPASSAADPYSAAQKHNGVSDDVLLADAEDGDDLSTAIDANTYRPFRLVRDALLRSLSSLMVDTEPEDLSPTTSIAGALTLALTYINKQNTLLAPAGHNKNLDSSALNQSPSLTSRILILSVSGDLAHQYIPIMNSIFACQRLTIPIDIAKIAGDTVFLQQASDATKGIYMKLEHPQGLLQYLMMAFLPDASSRQHLINLTQVGVDFRASCFCHRKVVDIGFVCSICLSIFCSPPEGAICLTCGTQLKLGDYGKKPAVIPKKKKKKAKAK